MDGVWDLGVTTPAAHSEIRVAGEQAGYYAADQGGTLLQFYVRPAFEEQGRRLFDHVLARASLTQAVASTIDPSCMSYCLDRQQKVTVHTYLYETNTERSAFHPDADGLDFRLLTASELDRTVAFQQACIQSQEDANAWAQDYSGNLIDRQELFVLCRDDDWLGVGELRRSDSQPGVTDLGMMVAPIHRGQGWATYILTLLRARCKAQGQRAICSTTVENVGAQIAIVRAGFVSRHRVVSVFF